MFLEVSDSQSSGSWSCFVSHRLAIVNQRDSSRSLVKESQVSAEPCRDCIVSYAVTVVFTAALRQALCAESLHEVCKGLGLVQVHHTTGAV